MKSAVSVDAYPGLVAWVQDGDRTTVFAHGVANTRTQARMTGRHRFKIASITKPMVAAVVLQLVEEGELSLSDSLEDWLPGTFPRGDDISIEHLLTHSSGLVDFDAIERLGKLVDSGRATPRSVVALSAKEPLSFDPGSQAVYSNTNYVVLGLIIEKVTQLSLEDNLHSRLFDPMRMSTASSHAEPLPDAPMAHGYYENQDITGEELGFALAAGGLVMTAGDVGRFFRGLFEGQVVAKEVVARMARDRVGPIEGWSGYGYGLGRVRTQCGLAYGHTGLTAGFVSEAWTLESLDRSAVVMANRAESVASRHVLWPIVETALCG